MKTVLLLLAFLIMCSLVLAEEEPKVFTDADLKGYGSGNSQMVDDSTVYQQEQELEKLEKQQEQKNLWKECDQRARDTGIKKDFKYKSQVDSYNDFMAVCTKAPVTIERKTVVQKKTVIQQNVQHENSYEKTLRDWKIDDMERKLNKLDDEHGGPLGR